MSSVLSIKIGVLVFIQTASLEPDRLDWDTLGPPVALGGAVTPVVVWAATRH
jgi:hypothetical protein